MPDAFHSCEITPNGISIKVLKDGVGHRSAIGVNDYKGDRPAYIAAVASMLEGHLGKNLAALTASLSTIDPDKDALIAKLKAKVEVLGGSHP